VSYAEEPTAAGTVALTAVWMSSATAVTGRDYVSGGELEDLRARRVRFSGACRGLLGDSTGPLPAGTTRSSRLLFTAEGSAIAA
jgi:hypothetical protein